MKALGTISIKARNSESLKRLFVCLFVPRGQDLQVKKKNQGPQRLGKRTPGLVQKLRLLSRPPWMRGVLGVGEDFGHPFRNSRALCPSLEGLREKWGRERPPRGGHAAALQCTGPWTRGPWRWWRPIVVATSVTSF